MYLSGRTNIYYMNQNLFSHLSRCRDLSVCCCLLLLIGFSPAPPALFICLQCIPCALSKLEGGTPEIRLASLNLGSYFSISFFGSFCLLLLQRDHKPQAPRISVCRWMGHEKLSLTADVNMVIGLIMLVCSW